MGYKEVFELVKQLSISEIEKLERSIRTELIHKPISDKKEKLRELILNAPTWSDDDYSNYLAARKHINQSRIS